MTVSAAFCPLSLQTIFNQNGCPAAGGFIFFYDAETTNERTVYQDAALTKPLTSPVQMNAYGRIPPIWVDVGNYKAVIKDCRGALLDMADDLPGGVEIVPASTVSNYWNPGDMKFAHHTDVQDGWVVANGQTIGSANSSATSRADDDTQILFTLLWNQDKSLAVSGGRGPSATSDFSGSKTISLPDYRGRGARGVDQMGAGATAGVITATTTPTPNTIGADVGAEAATIGQANLPDFAPTITVTAAGGFTPAGTLDSQGSHNHPLTDPGHPHNYRDYSATNATPNTGGSQVLLGNGGVQSQTQPATTGISLAPSGLHVHNFTGAPQPDHTHVATASNLGSGAPLPVMPPDVLGYWHIKL